MTSSHVVTITSDAFDSIRRETLRRSDGMETGGILLGHSTADSTRVTVAGAPGPHAVHEATRFLRDLDFAQSLALSAWDTDGTQWIGEWHSHPNGSHYPSNADMTSYLRHLTDAELRFDRFLALVVAAPLDRTPTLATWLVSRHWARAIRIVVEPAPPAPSVHSI